jgi:hypothetical protein
MLSEYQKFQTRRWWRRKVRKALKLWKNINVLFRSGINQPIKKNFVFVRRFVWLDRDHWFDGSRYYIAVSAAR